MSRKKHVESYPGIVVRVPRTDHRVLAWQARMGAAATLIESAARFDRETTKTILARLLFDLENVNLENES